MVKHIDVTSICNALIDIVYEVSEEELKVFNITKGHMHLIDSKDQSKLLEYFKGKHTKVEIGGSSLNAIRALALLNKKTSFTGIVAKDKFGDEIQDRFNDLEILNNLSISGKGSTGTSQVMVTPDGERTMSTYLGASCLLTPDLIPVNDIKNSKVLHVSGYQWGSPEQISTAETAMRIAKASGCMVSFDLADPMVVNANKETFVKIIEDYADIVFANEEEAKLLFNMSHEKTAKKIDSLGAIAAIKLGSKGSYIFSKEQSFYQDIVPVSVVDTTAAGDMYAAGFLYGIVSQMSLKNCAATAASLASDVISTYGATLSTKIISEVLNKETKSSSDDMTINREQASCGS